ncbi:Ribosomal protein L11 methyltransferase [bioreactor metagenome]|uniref:Ribosomal protein L11 methyltransferase n=1 Tax=bioreactor metagenome TaxID=1076179 RepID=A0A645EFX3_9ZZZZ
MIEENNQNKEIWIDAGTGTGVLAVVEAKLGAKKVYAFDNDDWSYQNAKENVLLNKVDDIVEVSQAEIAEFDFCEVDCISANMFFSLIISSLPKFYKSLQQNKGTLFISGILVYDREELITITEKNNFILIEEMQELEWCCFRFIAK